MIKPVGVKHAGGLFAIRSGDSWRKAIGALPVWTKPGGGPWPDRYTPRRSFFLKDSSTTRSMIPNG
jgi:hypothetical protein